LILRKVQGAGGARAAYALRVLFTFVLLLSLNACGVIAVESTGERALLQEECEQTTPAALTPTALQCAPTMRCAP
jgi:hypothetical protein